MKRKQKIWVKLLQALAIIIVIVALLSTGLYFLGSKSAKSAEEKQALPGVFKYSWVPIADEKFADIAKKDSLAVIEQMDSTEIAVSDAVVYETPTTSTDNVVYKNYSMGRVIALQLDTEKIATIKSTTGGADIVIPAEMIHGKATMQIAILGKLFTMISSSMGFILFVILPFFTFLVLQIIVIICRILSGRVEEDDEDDEDEEEYYYEDESYAPQRNTEPEYDQSEYDAPPPRENSRKAAARPVYSQEPAVKADRQSSSRSGYMEQEPLEPLELSFKNSSQTKPTEIKSQTVSTVVNGEYAATVPHTEVRQPIAQSAPSMYDRAPINKKPILNQSQVSQQTMPNFDAAPAYNPNGVIQTSTQTIPSTSYPRDGSYSEVSAQVDDFLKSLNYDEKNIEQEMMQHATVEFNLDDVRRQMVREELLKDYDRASKLPPAESQEMLEKILIELKGNAVDFSFQNSGPEDVQVQKSDTGNMFSVKTANYKANIKIEIDKD